MFVFSNEGNKVIHTEGCSHVKRISAKNFGKFESLTEARAAGYRMCHCCSPISRQYKAENGQLMEFCQNYGLSFYLNDECIYVDAPMSSWKIVMKNSGAGMLLLHKNTIASDGYHRQNVYKLSIGDYLQYIVEHDEYRMNNPLVTHSSKKNRPAPMKGTKRYKKQEKKNKRAAHSASVRNVLNILSSLSA